MYSHGTLNLVYIYNILSRLIIGRVNIVTMASTTRTRLFVGYSSVDTSIKQTQYTDLDLIKRDLINHFYTRKGERVMMPTFGSIIWDMIFEPMTADNVTLIVEDSTNIVQQDTRINLQSINLVQYDHGIQLQMNIYYQPLNIVEAFSLDFDRRTVEATAS
jgi:phage baseplate assembly protein W